MDNVVMVNVTASEFSHSRGSKLWFKSKWPKNNFGCLNYKTFYGHLDNTYKDFTHNNFTYNINKRDLKYTLFYLLFCAIVFLTWVLENWHTWVQFNTDFFIVTQEFMYTKVSEGCHID